jgi:diaminopimelate decarboxylase
MTAGDGGTGRTPRSPATIPCPAPAGAAPEPGAEARVRQGCHGIPPMSARLEAWQVRFCSRPALIRDLVETHGSPLHLHHPGPFERNIEALRDVAVSRGLPMEVLFARKANRALVYVDRAVAIRAGVDTAGEEELIQSLARGVPPERMVSTAAIKTEALVRSCIDAGVPLVVDNRDELDRVARCAERRTTVASIMVRVSGFTSEGQRLVSRFGFDRTEVPDVGAECANGRMGRWLSVIGLHFHLDGYQASHRIDAIAQCLPLVDTLRAQGHPLDFLDIGGGVPISYVDDRTQWQQFQRELERALRGQRPPITYRTHGLGLHRVNGRPGGALAVYPCHQRPVGSEWLEKVLDAPLAAEGDRVGSALRRRGLVLRLEPGRSVLDGCGLTVARVEHRKPLPDGTLAVGLCMNRSQCSTSKADHVVDPLLLPVGRDAVGRTPPVEGFLTGAYCTESDLITWRRLRFPLGVSRGDLVVFPNTAGYLMHFVESRSHQFPLARNLIVSPDLQDFRLDPVDQVTDPVVPARDL